jgi:hypothetical protein
MILFRRDLLRVTKMQALVSCKGRMPPYLLKQTFKQVCVCGFLEVFVILFLKIR